MSAVKETKLGSFDISGAEIQDVGSRLRTVLDIKKEIGVILGGQKGAKTTKIVEVILAGALAVNASDVHLEPQQQEVRLRLRLDGVLNDVLQIDPATYNYLLSRIKLVSGVKLNVKTEAQDGRFSIKVGEFDVEVRVSVLPGSYGESVVMRILNPNALSVSMEELGLEPRLHALLDRELERPNGMILNTGPTGSGKTTTLYAFLKKVHKPDVKIITIENPVEYHLPGIVQTQADPEHGYTFSDGLRAALRQDPDIIMVGEIRDTETAETAVAAASTGHLVFSTLHTNNAAGTFPRLLTLGVNPKVISSAVTVAMAQRLARKLCPSCKKESALGAGDKKLVKDIVNSIRLDEYKDVQQEKMWVATGCQKCNETGYKGRIGIFEAIVMTPEIEEVILKNPSEHEVKSAAINQNTLSMLQDGIVKALKGVTTMDELRRVLDFENEARSKQKNDADR
ncbi:hypothetical protein A3A38_01270 [Candidatus Kaiserbacteria bacterium RIFCSPLOWO2_01_FULL_53_17]|uniref:Bacterial type II secretion system protein E domain-containing protein n=1 Tax=Candidatus Kaiserbacteria bacterium RIFCSPLOWO2_01_FULL_53_17 TaxID=1798511 RepID=A0A1F6EGS8_9BACT|nr:MAG: hypothetical protein A3A38_01270 [Candidatus Kaiserbacteria bacterium RIFCSPLOWO2_01_FULL_53_17]